MAPASRTKPAATSAFRPVPQRRVLPRHCTTYRSGLGATVDFEYVHPAAGQRRTSAADLGAFSATGSSGAGPSASPGRRAGVTGRIGSPEPSGPSGSPGPSVSSPPGSSGPTVSGQATPDGWTGPLQFLGKGPNGYDNGEHSACTGSGGGSPAVLCVKAGAGGGGTGTSAAPFATINAALAAARPGDVIQVAAGTYPENVAVGTQLSALVPTQLTLLGGFSPDFPSRDASQFRSVIDGSGKAAPAVQLHLQSDGKTVLDGFRITGGRGLGNTYEDGNGRGGGVFVEILGNGEVLISHNEIYGNQTSKFEDEGRGGGINADGQDYDGSTPTIRIEDNVVHSNQAGRGAGINVTGHKALILRNVVEANRAHSDHGGGIYVSTAKRRGGRQRGPRQRDRGDRELRLGRRHHHRRRARQAARQRDHRQLRTLERLRRVLGRGRHGHDDRRPPVRQRVPDGRGLRAWRSLSMAGQPRRS